MGSGDEALQQDAGTAQKTAHAGLLKAVVVLLVLVAFLAWFGWSSYRDFEVRSKFAEIYAEGFELEARTADEFADPPGTATSGDHVVAPHTRYVRRIVVSRADRSIVLWLEPAVFDEPGVAEGAALRFTYASDGASWACKADRIPPRYVPVPCRG